MSATPPPAVIACVRARVESLQQSLRGYVDWQNELNDSQRQIDLDRTRVANELNELKLYLEVEAP